MVASLHASIQLQHETPSPASPNPRPASVATDGHRASLGAILDASSQLQHETPSPASANPRPASAAIDDHRASVVASHCTSSQLQLENPPIVGQRTSLGGGYHASPQLQNENSSPANMNPGPASPVVGFQPQQMPATHLSNHFSNQGYKN
jgi:hypothetical protein